jgi:DNA-binding transcriptional LysR family regulator
VELRHLRYFAAVARTEHFGRAAQILGVAQPALSRQIKQLEEEIGAELFERLPRGVRLTEAGAAYAAEVDAILSHVDAANKRAKNFAIGNAGNLSVGFNEIASYHDSVPRRINAFRHTFPEIALNLQPLSSVAQIRALHEGKLDAAIVYDVFHSADEERALKCITISSSTIRLAIPASHHLAKKKTIDVGHLKNEPLVWLSRDNLQPYNNKLLSGCVQSGLSPVIIQEVSTLSIQLSLVSAGMGLALVGSEVESRMPRDLILRNVRGLDVSFSLILIWRRDNDAPALANLIRQLSR